MKEVFHNKSNVAIVDENWLRFLKERAERSPLRRSRLCLHRAPGDLVHEMIIAMCKDVLFPPHRHFAKTESFHMIEGELEILVFDDYGTQARVIRLGAPGSGTNFCYRLCAQQFHAVLPLSEIVVFHETTTGPWSQGDAELAPWAPTDTQALREFLHESARSARTHSRTLKAAEIPVLDHS